MNSRATSFILIIVVILMGLASRKISVLPLFTGDILWAEMVYLMVRFVLIAHKVRLVAAISLGICYLIEISQLYHDPWIDFLRDTTLGALVLGHGFLWSDILAYTFGITICIIVEIIRSKQNLASVVGNDN